MRQGRATWARSVAVEAFKFLARTCRNRSGPIDRRAIDALDLRYVLTNSLTLEQPSVMEPCEDDVRPKIVFIDGHRHPRSSGHGEFARRVPIALSQSSELDVSVLPHAPAFDVIGLQPALLDGHTKASVGDRLDAGSNHS